MPLVEEAVRSWELVRQGVIAELDNIPEEQWDHRAGDGARSVRELARHIAEAGAGFVAELVSDDPRFARLLDPAHQAALRAALPAADDKAALLALLRSTGADGAAALRAHGERLVDERMPSFGGEASRLTGLYFAIGHESYHRGQVALLARGVGRVPALTQQIASRQRAPR